jgi:hypothetical protein
MKTHTTMFLGVFVSAIAPLTPAVARDQCPPLPTSASTVNSEFCVARVTNYGTVTDTGVTIALYNDFGQGVTCTPLSIPAGGSVECHVENGNTGPATTICGALITGEASNSQASLSVETGLEVPGYPLASVSCD